MPGTSRLDISTLEGEVCRFLEAGLAESTRKVYKAGWNRYLAFAQSLSIPDSPVTIESATLFAAFLGTEGLSAATIESYLAALRHIRVLANPGCLAPSLHSPHMKVLLRGIRRLHAQQDSSSRIRLPITASIMRRIKTQLARDPTVTSINLSGRLAVQTSLASSGVGNSWCPMAFSSTPPTISVCPISL